jgi:hypothetical protein
VRVFLLLLPAGVSLLALAARFLRRMNVVGMAACLALFALLFVRISPVRRVLQLALAAGTLVWAATASQLVEQRRTAGMPWARTALILSVVAGVSAVAALLLERAAARRYFGEGPHRGRERGRPGDVPLRHDGQRSHVAEQGRATSVHLDERVFTVGVNGFTAGVGDPAVGESRDAL